VSASGATRSTVTPENKYFEGQVLGTFPTRGVIKN
jgi:hypothetical protein